MNTYSATSKTEVYNAVTGYTTNTTLPSLYINQEGESQGDVTVNAVVVGSQPSSISTTGDVFIYGNNVAINSTINHKLGTSSGGYDLEIIGEK